MFRFVHFFDFGVVWFVCDFWRHFGFSSLGVEFQTTNQNDYKANSSPAAKPQAQRIPIDTADYHERHPTFWDCPLASATDKSYKLQLPTNNHDSLLESARILHQAHHLSSRIQDSF